MKFDELKALYEIKDGKKLSEFKIEDYEWGEDQKIELPTRLMILAALTYHKKEGYLEVPDGKWTSRAAIIAVSKNFRALDLIPEEAKPKAIPAILEASGKVTRKELPVFMEVLNHQPVSVLKKCIKLSPDISRFFNSENRVATEIKTQAGGKKMPPAERIPEKPTGMFVVDFSSDPELSDPDEVTPQMFLSLPVKEQTIERLRFLLNSKEDFPADFIKRLSIPNRNAAYYTKIGDQNKAAFWRSKIIPYLGLEICREIANQHPEGSIETKGYLSKEGIEQFWIRKREGTSKLKMTQYFLAFPEELLSSTMVQDIILSDEVLNHAPSIFLGLEETRKYLNRNPASILNLPRYQTLGRILAQGVPLTTKSLLKIKDENMRRKVSVALNIPCLMESYPEQKDA